MATYQSKTVFDQDVAVNLLRHSEKLSQVEAMQNLCQGYGDKYNSELEEDICKLIDTYHQLNLSQKNCLQDLSNCVAASNSNNPFFEGCQDKMVECYSYDYSLESHLAQEILTLKDFVAYTFATAVDYAIAE
jgi:hypothetical protein